MNTPTVDSNQAIAWRQEIDLYSENLVELADETLSPQLMGRFNRDMRTAQLNNLLGVALEAEGVAAVRNWIMYQMGRRETSRAWGESGFGEQVLDDFSKIRQYAAEIVDKIYSDLDERLRNRAIQKTNITLVRLYVGYLKRWFVARGGQN